MDQSVIETKGAFTGFSFYPRQAQVFCTVPYGVYC